jgi:hypothetical protein
MGRPTVRPDICTLIRDMSNANSRRGPPRIHGELLKLGIDVSQATVAKYLVRGRRPPSQTWRTFLRNHVGQIVAADFFVVPTATYRLLFVLVLLAHDRRRIRHVAVTAHPTAAWTAQQLREAFPWDQAPRWARAMRGGGLARRVGGRITRPPLLGARHGAERHHHFVSLASGEDVDGVSDGLRDTTRHSPTSTFQRRVSARQNGRLGLNGRCSQHNVN